MGRCSSSSFGFQKQEDDADDERKSARNRRDKTAVAFGNIQPEDYDGLIKR